MICVVHLPFSISSVRVVAYRISERRLGLRLYIGGDRTRRKRLKVDAVIGSDPFSDYASAFSFDQI